MMDSQDGMTLDRYLGERGPLEAGKVLRLAVQVAQQLRSESSAQIISPSRILVTRTGTVRLLPPPAEDLALPAIVEFPTYASPEEIRGEKPDVRSTLYSLGCTLYELLAGSPPYTGSDPRSVLRAHVEDPVPDVRQAVPGVSSALGETIVELLEKDRSLRIQTPDELIRRLRQAGLHSSAPAESQKRASDAPAPAPAPLRGQRGVASKGSLRGGARPPRVTSSPRGAERGSKAAVSGVRAGAGKGRLAAARSSTSRFAKRDRVRDGSARGGPARTSSARSGAGRAGRRDFDEGYEDEPQGPVIVRRKSYPFTIGGAVLGLLIGLAIVISKMQQAKTVPAQEQDALVEENAEALAARKNAFAAELKSKKETIDQLLVRLQRMPEDRRRDFLVESLNANSTVPGAYRLAKPLQDMGPPDTSTRRRSSEDSSSESYDAFLAKARQLHEVGKLGPAYMLLVDDGRPFEDEHESEMNKLIEEWSDELTAKWERDKERIDQLALQGDGDGALRVCRDAIEYGDAQIIQEANRKIEGIQSQLDIQQSLKDTAKPEPKDDEFDLDAQLKEFQSEGQDPGSDGKKGADDLDIDIDLGDPLDEL